MTKCRACHLSGLTRAGLVALKEEASAFVLECTHIINTHAHARTRSFTHTHTHTSTLAQMTETMHITLLYLPVGQRDGGLLHL
jgi:hypothetical protein